MFIQLHWEFESIQLKLLINEFMFFYRFLFCLYLFMFADCIELSFLLLGWCIADDIDDRKTKQKQKRKK